MSAGRWWPAPAKINLFLHVTGRRPDGFHDLQTIFQLLDWGDELQFEPLEGTEVVRAEGNEAVPAEQDLVVRAARALQQASGVRAGVRIRLRKRVPMGGGLGGGSSDAATTLRVLDRLWGTHLGVDALARLGLALGSDVPVFVRGSSAWGEGRGENLIPVAVPEAWYLLIHPGVPVGTAGIFQAPELTRNSPVTTIRAFSPDLVRNDCEPAVRGRYPAVAEALDWLGRHGRARLSGTGACVFAAFDRAIDAERVAARVPDTWRARVARGVARSPLLAVLGE